MIHYLKEMLLVSMEVVVSFWGVFGRKHSSSKNHDIRLTEFTEISIGIRNNDIC